MRCRLVECALLLRTAPSPQVRTRRVRFTTSAPSHPLAFVLVCFSSTYQPQQGLGCPRAVTFLHTPSNRALPLPPQEKSSSRRPVYPRSHPGMHRGAHVHLVHQAGDPYTCSQRQRITPARGARSDSAGVAQGTRTDGLTGQSTGRSSLVPAHLSPARSPRHALPLPLLRVSADLPADIGKWVVSAHSRLPSHLYGGGRKSSPRTLSSSATRRRGYRAV
jgi:hypothetical protein